MGLLDKALEIKETASDEKPEESGVEDLFSLDEEMPDLPDLPDVTLSEGDNIFASGSPFSEQEDGGSILSELDELPETAEPASLDLSADEPSVVELESSDLMPLESESESRGLLISDSDLLPDDESEGERRTPAFSLSEDDLVISDELEPAPSAAVSEPPDLTHETADPEALGEVQPVSSDIPLPDRSAVLWEAAREIVKSQTPNDFFNVLILLAMGHLEASTASVVVPVKGEEQSKWVLRDSRGTRLSAKTITFKPADRIMNDILCSDRIVDIERYSSDGSCTVEYNLFHSIDARLAIPLRGKEKVNAVFVLGNRLSGDEYTAADYALASDLCAFASTVFDRIVTSQRLSEENAAFSRKGTEAAGNESFEKQLLLCADNEASALIQDRLRSYGIDSYAFFSRTEQGEAFYPVFTEKEDFVTFRSSAFTVPAASEFCQYLLRAGEWEEFENPGTTELLKKLFGDQLILKMNIFIVSPFVVRGHLAGFMLVLRARRELLAENASHASLFVKMVLRHVLLCESVYIDDARFVDSVSRVFRRLERCIDYAAGLRIPVAAIVFSVRNIKRYCALYGAAEGEELMRRFRSIVETRLSLSEFAVRTDRGKLLVLLPGKTKKYAVPFANAVRNELASHYKERESQIMLTFMTGEYPADGKNIHELLDYLD